MNAGPAAYEVYAQELYNRAWGYPLWEPEPEARGEVLIGDVGYLRHGAFYRLFNAVTVVDGETQRTGTPNPPSGSARFILDQSLVHSKSNAMSKGPHYSRSVRRIGMGADAGTHGAKFGFECECTSQYGAMVILDTPGIREEVHQDRRMKTHMKNNIDVWHQWATGSDARNREPGLDISLEDIFFVQGWTKTTRWGVVSFFGDSRSMKLTIEGNVPAMPASAGVHFGLLTEREHMPEHRVGPVGRGHSTLNSLLGMNPSPDHAQAQGKRGKNKKSKSRGELADQRYTSETDASSLSSASLREDQYPADQCMFLHYFKAKKRLLLPTKIEAAAEPQDPSMDRDAEDAMELIEEIPPRETPYDPVMFVLDYILQHSEAKIAIASDFDLIRVCESRSDEDRPKLIPDDIPRFLEEVQPDIEVTEDGLGLLQFIDDDTAVHIAESAKAGDALPSAPTAGSLNTTSTEPTPHKEAGDDHGGRRGDSAVSGPGASDTSQVDSGAGAIDINSATPPSSRDEDKWKLGDQYHVLPLPPLSSEQRRGGISALAYSPVGREIAAGFEDNTIIVWTAMNRSVRFQFEEHSDTVSSLVFSPDGSKLVSGGRDGRVIIWDLIDGGSIRSLNAHQGAVERVAYSADGKLIASGADSVVKLWEAETGNLRGTTEEHGGIIMYVVFSPDNERFVSTSSDGSARVWSTHTASHVCDLKGHEGVIYTIAYSHDGRRLVTGADDGTARIWSALIGDEFARLSEGEGGSVWAAAFSADGKELHSVGSERVIKTYDSFTAELIDTIDGGDKVAMAPAFSADGRLLAAGGEDHIITVWDMATKQEVVQLPGHTDNVNYLAFSHDNRHITSASDDGTVCKWELPALVTTTA